MQTRTASFWREIVRTYLAYLLVGLTATPAAIAYAYMSLRGPVSSAEVAVLAAFSLACIPLVLRYSRSNPVPTPQYAIISFDVVPGGVASRRVTTAVAASVLVFCLSPDGSELKGIRVGVGHAQSADRFFCVVPSA
jgi:hypothetical protein